MFVYVEKTTKAIALYMWGRRAKSLRLKKGEGVDRIKASKVGKRSPFGLLFKKI